MRLLGVIAEYNPFHNGHAYMLREAKQAASADACVVVMSGCFTQRGEMAILDKWKRAELALSGGADLVIEIPTVYVLADAGRYASAGVELLVAIGCDAIAFGSECGDIDALRRVATTLESKKEELEAEIAAYRRQGFSYPAARERAYCELASEDCWSQTVKELEILSSSNDILAVEYLRALMRCTPNMDVYAIGRQGAGYNDAIDCTRSYQSASGIRQAIKQGAGIDSYVPAQVATALDGITAESLAAREDRMLLLLRNLVLRTTVDELEDSPSAGEGLASRLKSAILGSESIDEIIEFTKSKRYTYTRISRLLAQVLLGIRRDDAKLQPCYARVLGFNSVGQNALSHIKKNELNNLPIITNINKECEELGEDARRLLELDALAVSTYNLIDDRALYANADAVKKPVILTKIND